MTNEEVLKKQKEILSLIDKLSKKIKNKGKRIKAANAFYRASFEFLILLLCL